MSLIFRDSPLPDEDDAANTAFFSMLMATFTGINAAIFAENTRKKLTGELTPSQKLNQIRTTNTLTNLTLTSWMMGQYYLGNEKKIAPAAVLAGMPLGTVEELSMALSDRLVKYRATGGVFLAHQDGGNESLRIICKAWGKTRNIFLILLDWLFHYGSAKGLDMFASYTSNILNPEEKDIWSMTDLKDRSEVNNPWKHFDTTNTEEGRAEYHMTFPIVTKNRVYTNMYLETYDIVESVNNGMNVLTISLFLRKYKPPYPYIFVRVRNELKGQKQPDTTYWYRSQQALQSTLSLKVKSLRWLDSVMDFGLSLIVVMNKYYRIMEYTVHTPEEMHMLDFASSVDKGKGVNKINNTGITKENGKIVSLSDTCYEDMGIEVI
jgi:hypothetical protein